MKVPIIVESALYGSDSLLPSVKKLTEMNKLGYVFQPIFDEKTEISFGDKIQFSTWSG